MRNIANLPAADRRALFSNTASEIGLTDSIVEKDFWVCWTLDYLFHRCKWKNYLSFKGGTSLSKAYRLIERFSEDIDLILDWRVLGYDSEEPWMQRSNTKQDLFNKEANNKAAAFLQDSFLPVFYNDALAELKSDFIMKIDTEDEQTVLFTYPQEFSDKTILQEIRLEIGALAAWTPAEQKLITPYAAEQYTSLFDEPETSVLTVMPERTFWEKTTILHREANRPADSSMPLRYSRHYYDLWCMANSWVKEKAFIELELLKKVVLFKEKFYRCPWAGYENALPGNMKLLPPQHSLSILEDDYEHMKSMIFGDKPAFTDLIKSIKGLEEEINLL